MAKPVKQLTTARINAAKPKDKVYYIADGAGLRLAIRPNGTKTWLFNYTRPYIKKRSDKTIGTYPAVNLADAREKANKYRELLAKNIDPHQFEIEQENKARFDLNNTFRTVAEEWLDYREKLGMERNDYCEKTKHDTKRRVNAAIDLIGDIPFKDLKLKHGMEVIEPYRKIKAYHEVKRRYFLLKKIAEYAERFGYWEKNEWRYLGEDLPPVIINHFPAINYKELPEFLSTLRNASVHYSTLLAILWGLLNATRSIETVTAKMTDISANKSLPGHLVWTVQVHKGNKGTRNHFVPLSKQAQTLLGFIKKHAHGDYLFPSMHSGRKYPHIYKKTLNDAIAAMGDKKYKGIMTNHGMRTIFSSYLNDNRMELGLDSEIIEICLSHLNSDKVRNAYNRAEYLPYRLKTFQAWADYVELCANGLFDEIKSK